MIMVTEIPARHPARLPAPIIYADSEGRPWKRVRNLSAASQSVGDFIRYDLESARALATLGAKVVRKTVYP